MLDKDEIIGYTITNGQELEKLPMTSEVDLLYNLLLLELIWVLVESLCYRFDVVTGLLKTISS